MQWRWISFLDYFYQSSPNVLIHSEPPPILRKKLIIIILGIWVEIHQSRTWGRFHICIFCQLMSICFAPFFSQQVWCHITAKFARANFMNFAQQKLSIDNNGISSKIRMFIFVNYSSSWCITYNLTEVIFWHQTQCILIFSMILVQHLYKNWKHI